MTTYTLDNDGAGFAYTTGNTVTGDAWIGLPAGSANFTVYAIADGSTVVQATTTLVDMEFRYLFVTGGGTAPQANAILAGASNALASTTAGTLQVAHVAPNAAVPVNVTLTTSAGASSVVADYADIARAPVDVGSLVVDINVVGGSTVYTSPSLTVAAGDAYTAFAYFLDTTQPAGSELQVGLSVDTGRSTGAILPEPDSNNSPAAALGSFLW